MKRYKVFISGLDEVIVFTNKMAAYRFISYQIDNGVDVKSINF